MIIDAHINVDSDRFGLDVVLPVLARSHIGSAVIFADPHSEDLDRQNRYVLDEGIRHDLYPFYYLGGNPWTDTRPDILELPDNIGDYCGFRWHRWIGEAVDMAGIPNRAELEWAVGLMETPEFESFVAAAAHYRMPVVFEESLSVTVEFATRYPVLDIIVPHMGLESGGEANVLRALWDVPNVYFGTSRALMSESTFARLGTERIIFGSGYPYGDPEVEVDKIDKLPIPDEAKEDILGDTLLSLLEGTGANQL